MTSSQHQFPDDEMYSSNGSRSSYEIVEMSASPRSSPDHVAAGGVMTSGPSVMTSPTQMEFVTSVPTGDLSGSIAGEGIKRRKGALGSALHSKGFGWLLDVEEMEDDQKPLLEELDIDLTDIYYKVRCVMFPLPSLGFNRSVLKDSPDFWGPLFIILLFSLVSLYGQFHVISGF